MISTRGILQYLMLVILVLVILVLVIILVVELLPILCDRPQIHSPTALKRIKQSKRIVVIFCILLKLVTLLLALGNTKISSPEFILLSCPEVLLFPYATTKIEHISPSSPYSISLVSVVFPTLCLFPAAVSQNTS